MPRSAWHDLRLVQIRIRDLAMRAVAEGSDLPEAYYRKMRWWFWLGWPAFIALLGVFWLMVAKPVAV